MKSTIQPTAARRPNPVAERVQREFELGRAYVAAKTLEERLELAGLDSMAHSVRDMREEIALAFNTFRQDG